MAPKTKAKAASMNKRPAAATETDTSSSEVEEVKKTTRTKQGDKKGGGKKKGDKKEGQVLPLKKYRKTREDVEDANSEDEAYPCREHMMEIPVNVRNSPEITILMKRGEFNDGKVPHIMKWTGTNTVRLLENEADEKGGWITWGKPMTYDAYKEKVGLPSNSTSYGSPADPGLYWNQWA